MFLFLHVDMNFVEVNILLLEVSVILYFMIDAVKSSESLRENE